MTGWYLHPPKSALLGTKLHSGGRHVSETLQRNIPTTFLESPLSPAPSFAAKIHSQPQHPLKVPGTQALAPCTKLAASGFPGRARRSARGWTGAPAPLEGQACTSEGSGGRSGVLLLPRLPEN